jgi:ribose transport system ATP-binding protein
VHGIVGENGSGKSTFIKVISGAIKPDSGSIIINGKVYYEMDPILSKENGIAVVYQELIQYDALAVYENIFIELEQGKLFVNKKELKEKTKELLMSFNADIPPEAIMRTLSIANRQIVEIVKAMIRKVKIVIMDEPTASISLEEQKLLLRTIKDMKERGITVIYISHRLEELFEICDRVTILRDGKYVDTRNIKDVDKKKLISLMVGRELLKVYPENVTPSENVVLMTEKLSGNGLKDINIKLHKGEILGFAGLVGAGRSELMHLILGAAKKTGGNVYLKGRRVMIKTPSEALKAGITIIPEDRKVQGCFVDKKLFWNVSVSNLKHLCRGVFIIEKKERNQAIYYKDSLNIKTPSIDQIVLSLSGGNQQKVVIAKALAAEPDILIFDEPTKGIDIGARHEIYTIMIELLKKGKSILMVSSDMEELLGMSNRIVVLCQGNKVGELTKSQFNQEQILELASGMGVH